VPCLSLLINPIGLAVGIWILALAASGSDHVSLGLTVLAGFNVLCSAAIVGYNWFNAWRVSAQVLDSRWSRLYLAFRVNPLFVMAYWLFWVVALVIGIQMFVRDKGLTWERTEKIDANHDLVRALELGASTGPPVGAGRSGGPLREDLAPVVAGHTRMGTWTADRPHHGAGVDAHLVPDVQWAVVARRAGLSRGAAEVGDPRAWI